MNRTMLGSTIIIFTFVIAALFPVHNASASNEDLSILEGWANWTHARYMLQRRLNSLAFELLEQRRRKIEGLTTAEDWKARQDEVRNTFRRIIGPFPTKTPLNARVLGVIRKDGYRIEKIVFESRPNFYVTSCLFIPDGSKGRRPAILNVIGHTDISFRDADYQQLLLNLVKKGFIVLAMDPIGQGERLQYYDPAVKRSVVGGPTVEHSYFGKQCFISNSSAARHFIWDGIRAIDYLVSRSEVDPHRIGVTGISGGGTQTSYIAALDDRVAAAAPTCYITSLQRLFESIGPQDAEQNLNGGVLHGIDHADFLELRAPKPTLVVSTTRDFFSIQGARETFAEAKKAFTSMGAEDELVMVEDDFGHGYTKKTREAIYSFFQKFLSNPGSSLDETVEMLPSEELTLMASGQVTETLGGETVFSINRTETKALIDRLEMSRRNISTHLQKVKAEAAKISGYVPPGEMSGLVFRGRYQRAGYSVEKYVIDGEKDCVIPFLLMVPDKGSKHPALIYLHPEGKSAGAGVGGEMEGFVKQGYIVLSPDLSGSGELGSVSDYVAFLGVQIGRSIVGIRAGDIMRCVHYLKSRSDVEADQLVAVARGGMTIPLVHAAAFDTSIKQVALVEPLISLRSVVMNRFYQVSFSDMVTNALSAYDLPDLAASIAPRKLMLINVQDQVSARADRVSLEKEMAVVRSAYAQGGSTSNLTIRNWESFQLMSAIFAGWLK